MALNLQHTVKPNIPGDSGHRGCRRCGGRRLQILVAWFRVQGLEVIVYRKTLNPEHLRKIGTLFERKEKETREEHRVKCFPFILHLRWLLPLLTASIITVLTTNTILIVIFIITGIRIACIIVILVITVVPYHARALHMFRLDLS